MVERERERERERAAVHYSVLPIMIAAVGGNNIVRFTYTGGVIPRDATHIFVDVRVVRRSAFERHRNIVEVICHDKVEKIELGAFSDCYFLRRVIMPGVKIVRDRAFAGCEALTDVECDKLEIIGKGAFDRCTSLRSINLPSAMIAEWGAFFECKALTDVTFGSKLERIEGMVFRDCYSLERITIPLKDGMITHDDIFMDCTYLKHIDLVEGAQLNETIVALHMEEWSKDINEEMNSIHQILLDADAGGEWDDDVEAFLTGEKAQAIRTWIRSLIHKITRYKAEHQSVLNDATNTLQLALPQDIVMNNVLPFLDLPSYTFEEDNDSEEEEDVDSEDEEM